MRLGFFTQTLLFSSLGLLVRADDCSDGLHNNYVMGDGTHVGQQYADSDKPLFCETRWRDGLVVNGIEVWSSKWNVQAFRVRYSDGTWSKQHGNPNPDKYNHQEITWNTGELVESIKHRPNKVRDSPGQFEWKMKNQEMISFGSNRHWGDWLDANVYSGVLLGVWGKGNGDFLSSMQLLFLKTKVEGSEIIEMKFDKSIDEMNRKQDGIEEIFLSRVAIENTNKDGTNKTYSFANEATREKTLTVEVDIGHTVSAGTTLTVSGKAGVPLLAEGSVSASVSAGFEATRMEKDSTQNKRAWKMSWSEGISGNLLAPGKAAVCKATAFQGSYSSGFTSTIKASLGDGSSFTYKQRGQFDSVGYAEGSSNCEIMPIDKIPSGFKREEAKEAKPKRAVHFVS